MDRRRHSDMPRGFDMEGRQPRGQYTSFRSTTFTASQSRHQPAPRQSRPVGNSMAGPSRQRRQSQVRPQSVPSWINELPRDYPEPPPVRPAPPPRTQFGQFQGGTSVTPSNSASQMDLQSFRTMREGRTTLARDQMPRGASAFARQPESQLRAQRDTYGYEQRPVSFYQPNGPQQVAPGPEMPPVVNNYLTTNNHQQYNIDNSRHQQINAQGQRNTHNLQYRSATYNRRDTTENSRTTQRMSASGHQHHHRQSRHHREYRG